MAKKGENIYRRRDGRWEGRYIKGHKPTGKPIFGSVYAKQYAEVKAKLIMVKANCLNEEKWDTSLSPTFRQWSSYWLKVYCQPYVKASTCELYQRMLTLHLFPCLGELRLDEIGETVLKPLMETLRGKLAANTLAGVYRLLRAILKEANQRGVLPRLPPRIRLAKAVKREPRVLSLTEQGRLEREALRTGELSFLLALYTGLRVGELCGLRWSDLDLDDRLLTVRHAVKRTRQASGVTRATLCEPKTDCALRDIPIPAGIASQLKAIPRQSEFVFPGRRGACMDTRTMQLRLAGLTRRLGLKGVHTHTLRHTYATRCLEKQVGVETLSVLLGHSSPDITLRRYAHTTPDEKRRSVSRLKPLGVAQSQKTGAA